jgi:hypothetical protein
MGYLNPIIAAMMHNAGSLFVVFNSARLVRQGEELEPHLASDPSADRGGPSSTVSLAPQTV